MFSDEYSFEWNLNLAQLPDGPAAATVLTPAPDPVWSDAHTLAYLRAGWPLLSEREDHALRLLDDLCKPPHQRGTAWIMLVRTVQGRTLAPVKAEAVAV